MIRSSQPPLKYHTKGGSDFRVYSPDLELPFHSPTSSLSAYRFSSECSMPHSPTFYSSSSSVAPSSPIRSLYTPEPSSPLPEPHIESSPKSPRSTHGKGFWEVAFNYGPDFPYKGHSTVQGSNFSRQQFITRRRGSSASAPPLVSDVDPSDCSEDTDAFHMDDDVTDEETAPAVVTIVNSKEEVTLDERRVPPLPPDDVAHPKDNRKILDGDIDAATVLLDLSRQVRFAPVESKSEDVAIKPKASDSLDLVRPSSPITEQVWHVDQETASFRQGLAITSSSCDVVMDEGMGQSNLDRRESHGQSTIFETVHVHSATSDSVADASVIATGGQTHSTEEHRCFVDPSIPSDNVAPGNSETTIASHSPNEAKALMEIESFALVEGKSKVMNPAVSTPISSPTLSAGELSELTELLSGPTTPKLGLGEPTGPTDDTRHEVDDLDMLSRPSSPVPGPSVLRFSTDVQHDASRSGKSQVHSKKGRSRSVRNARTNGSEQFGTKSKKKREHSGTAVRSCTSSPYPSASCSDIPKPRKKRTRRNSEHVASSRRNSESEAGQWADSSLSAPAGGILPAGSSSAPQFPETDIELRGASRKNENGDADARSEMCGCLIQAMALSRASSMPVSSLLREVLRENSHLANQRSKSDWLGLVLSILGSDNVFGRIDRKGFDADDKPLEAQWFYIPENDPDQDRASLLREMMPKKRSETKKHKQYFFKPLGKISRWDPEDAL